MRKNIVPLLLLLGTATGSFAQAPAGLYLKTMNSYLSPSPESSQLMKYQDFPVSLFTGTPQVSIPIYTASGKGISVPISISYHAGGGVKVDEQSTNIGLGFVLTAGGEIGREMRGGPDEGGSSGTAGFIGKPLKMWEYLGKYNTNSGYDDQQLWVDAMNGSTDLEPDIFYFSFGGYSGKFVYDDMLLKFVCLDDRSHLNIILDRSNMPNTVFTIITDDGNKYVFSARETSSSEVINKGPSAGTSPAGPRITTSWKLTKIYNADLTDSITLNYVGEHYSYYTGGANIAYQAFSGNSNTRNPILSYTNVEIDGPAKLSNITGNNFSVDFVDEAADRVDQPGSKALSKIVIKNSSNETENIFMLHHSWFERTSPVGPVLALTNLYRNSLRLDSISEYGNSETNPLPLRHAFTYDPGPLPARLSFAQDWWGYPNYNWYDESLVPKYSGHDWANRVPNFDRTAAGILTGIRLPTGGTVSYEYEPNTTAFSVEQASLPEDQLMAVIQDITQPAPGSTQYNIVSRNFTIDVPENAALNNSEGGVTANINFYPMAPVQPPGSGNIYGMPYYIIAKSTNLDWTVPGVGSTAAFTRNMQSIGEYGVHMPNGHYTMTFYPNGYNPPPNNTSEGEPPGQLAYFAVTYNAPDPNAPFPNYGLGGVRVKSVTTRDQYTKITQTRKFRYHDPVTDSSYGYYLGSAGNIFTEVSQFGSWTVRNGSFNMPGQANMVNSVFYPKVIEEVSDSGVTYRTEHYYTKGSNLIYGGNWPYAPVLDVECSRGNEYKTVMDKYTTSGFVPAAIKARKFNYEPLSYASGSQFARLLYGIKCSATSYDVNYVVSGGYAPPFINAYPIAVGNRLYLEADSSITYDLNNPNNAITEWHDYKYGDYNLQPMIARSGNSDGTVSIQKNYYVNDKPDADAVVNSILTPLTTPLTNTNRVTMPLGTKQFKDAQLLSSQYSYPRFDGSKLLVDSMRQSLFSNSLETEIKVLEYDNTANPLTIEMRGSKYRKYIWNKAKGLPLATAMVPKANAAFAFTSFEYPNEYTWTESSRSAYGPFAGYYYYDLNGGAVTCPNFYADAGVDVYVWATNTTDVKVNNFPMASTGRTKGNWTLLFRHIDASQTHPLGYFTTLIISGTAFIDNLVALPSGSQFQGNIYDKSNRVMAVVNEQISTSFYEYDGFGRLKTVRDEQGNIIKSTSYQYQGAQ